jgi:hypothetical protein
LATVIAAHKLRGEHAGQDQSVALQGQAGQAGHLLRLVPVGASDTEHFGFVAALAQVAQAVTTAAFVFDHHHDRGARGEQDRGSNEGATIEQIRLAQFGEVGAGDRLAHGLPPCGGLVVIPNCSRRGTSRVP